MGHRAMFNTRHHVHLYTDLCWVTTGRFPKRIYFGFNIFNPWECSVLSWKGCILGITNSREDISLSDWVRRESYVFYRESMATASSWVTKLSTKRCKGRYPLTSWGREKSVHRCSQQHGGNPQSRNWLSRPWFLGRGRNKERWLENQVQWWEGSAWGPMLSQSGR